MSEGRVRWNLLVAVLAAAFLAALGGLVWQAQGGAPVAAWVALLGLGLLVLWASFVAMVRRLEAPRPRADDLDSAWWGIVLLEGVAAPAAALGLVQLAASPWGLDAAGGAATLAVGLAGLLAGSLVLDRGWAPWVPGILGLVAVPTAVHAASAWPLAARYLGVLALWGLVRVVADPAAPGNEPLAGGAGPSEGSDEA